jgi:hypothetical protein
MRRTQVACGRFQRMREISRHAWNKAICLLAACRCTSQRSCQMHDMTPISAGEAVQNLSDKAYDMLPVSQPCAHLSGAAPSVRTRSRVRAYMPAHRKRARRLASSCECAGTGHGCSGDARLTAAARAALAANCKRRYLTKLLQRATLNGHGSPRQRQVEVFTLPRLSCPTLRRHVARRSGAEQCLANTCKPVIWRCIQWTGFSLHWSSFPQSTDARASTTWPQCDSGDER